MDRNWEKWEQNVKPAIMSFEDEKRRQTVRKKTESIQEDPEEFKEDNSDVKPQSA